MHAKVWMSGCWRMTSDLSLVLFRGQWYWEKNITRTLKPICVCAERTRLCHARGQRPVLSLMPCHPGRSLDGITGNWIVSRLLWEHPGWDPPSLSQPNTCRSHHPLPQAMHPYSHPITDARCTEPPAFTCHSKFPLVMQKHWSWMSAKCLIKWPRARHQQQHQSPSTAQCITLMGGSNMLRSCRVLLNFCSTNLSFLPQKCCEERWMKEKYSKWAEGSWW